jgi:hypothetical protein
MESINRRMEVQANPSEKQDLISKITRKELEAWLKW